MSKVQHIHAATLLAHLRSAKVKTLRELAEKSAIRYHAAAKAVALLREKKLITRNLSLTPKAKTLFK